MVHIDYKAYKTHTYTKLSFSPILITFRYHFRSFARSLLIIFVAFFLFFFSLNAIPIPIAISHLNSQLYICIILDINSNFKKFRRIPGHMLNFT